MDAQEESEAAGASALAAMELLNISRCAVAPSFNVGGGSIGDLRKDKGAFFPDIHVHVVYVFSAVLWDLGVKEDVSC
jgi:hypothetical protein